MNNPDHPIWQLIVTPANGKFLSVVTLLLVVAFLPLSIYLTQQEQDIRQEAAKSKNNGKNTNKNNNKETNKNNKNKKNNKNNKGKKAKIVRANEKKPVKRGDVPGVIMVKFKASAETTASGKATETKITNRHKGKQKKKLQKTRWREIEVPPGKEDAIIQELQNDPNVESVEEDAYAFVLAEPNDPEFTLQWGMQNIGQTVPNDKGVSTKGTAGADAKITSAWNKTEGSEDIVIAVLDTGIQTNHPDLTGKIVKSVNISDTASAADVFGHGTHVAGIIAANTNNAVGVAGTCPRCKIANIKVMNDQGQGLVSDIAAGIEEAIAMNVDVINLSVGTNEDKQVLRDAINAAWNAGIVVVAASGNKGENKSLYPAAYPVVISVGATDMNDNKPIYSNYGATVDVAAPGDAILSTYTGDDYSVMKGTSMAAPMVSGLAGLLLATDEYSSSAQTVRNRIEQTADKTGDEGTYWTYGRINAAKAVNAGTSTKPTVTPTPIISGPSVTGTVSKTPTPSTTTGPSATPDALASRIDLSVFVVGIGKAGDLTQSGTPGNQSPETKQREFMVEIIGQDGKPVKTAGGTLSYNEALGGYKGSIPVSNIQSGEYVITVSSLGTLKKRATGIFTLNQTKVTQVPATTLITGDINGDNVINILDFNLLAGCYSDQEAAKSCANSKVKAAADLNNDGQVNQFDYNLFIRNSTVQQGN